jgi:hypothetical protein
MMYLNYRRFYKKITAITLFAFSTAAGAQFLVDQNPEPLKVLPPAKTSEVRQSVGFPENTALNITAIPVEGSPNSIKISWELSDGSNDTFILGRSISLPNNPATALNAVSLKIIPSGSEKSFIDRNLPPGSYFYVILAKNKSAVREVDLYPNENYTTNPVVISDALKIVPQKTPQILGLVARPTENKTINLVWTPLNYSGVTYTVYRGSEPLNTEEKIKAAEKIVTLTDRDRYADGAAVPGKVYFYGVVTTAGTGIEDYQLIFGQACTESGVTLVDPDVMKIVSHLAGESAEKGGVNISWKGLNGFTGDYLIYRSKAAIDSSEMVDRADNVGTVSFEANAFYDVKAGTGNYYYAVIARDTGGNLFKTLHSGYNYLSKPVESKKAAYIRPRLRSVTAAINDTGKDITVSWKFTGDLITPFAIYRGETVPEDASQIEGMFYLDSINLQDKKYEDRDVPEGTYYYALVPEDLSEKEQYPLKKGINYNEKPLKIERKQAAAEPLQLRTLSAANNENAHEVQVNWQFTGVSGNKIYSIYRLEKLPESIDDIVAGYLVDSVDITLGAFTDKSIPDGEYYYALVPYEYAKDPNFVFRRGINYTLKSVVIGKGARHVAKKTPAEAKEKPKTGNGVTADIPNVVLPDVNHEKPLEKKKPAAKEKPAVKKKPVVVEKPAVKEPEIVHERLTNIDAVLRNYYYKSRFDDAIVDFMAIARNASDDYERGRALFFAGRCYAEKRDFNTALKFFVARDVKKNFAKEAAFWQDYCLSRMK